MYKGYNLEIDNSENQSLFGVEDLELEEYQKKIDEFQVIIKENFEKEFKLPRNDLNEVDASKIIKDWFPQFKVDVFISHSHSDTRTAKRLAVWLKREFDLNVFIDSMVWGYANKLLKIIDNKYSVLKQNEETTTYNYDTRNQTTSHVHMMLSTALNDMIYNTECLLFLNTPTTIKVRDVKKNTSSPWIYSELKMASIVEKKYPRKKKVLESIEKNYFGLQHENRSVDDFLYDVTKDLSKLENIKMSDLKNWKKLYLDDENAVHALDLLYFKMNEVTR